MKKDNSLNKKENKKDSTESLKLPMTFDQAMKKALNTPIKKKGKKSN